MSTLSQTSPAAENRLAAEMSPYLLQHKDNPVAWWAWGSEALAEAKRTHKPILLSVGYAACHWCHVMAHESFEDDDTAAVMKSLDLIVTSDTSIAHLAGALGVAVWVALPFVPDWRWLLERPDSPWYPTMRLLRCTSTDGWSDVLRRAARRLAAEAFSPAG